MATDPGPYDIDETRAILRPDGRAVPKDATPRFYEELDAEFDGFAGHVLVSRHSFDRPWAGWEMHPQGDEIVYLVDGAVDFVFRRDGTEDVVAVRAPGSYVIVPQNTWHTARPHGPTTMLFITPGEGTQHAAEPPE